LRRFWVRMLGWFGRSERERALSEEFQSHLEMQVDDNLRAGMTHEAARRAALLKLGGAESAKEALRDLWTVRWIDSTVQDLRFAIRGLRRSRGFAFAAILSIAIGLGASLAIFTVADNLLLRPLPYAKPSGLVMLWDRNTHNDLGNPFNITNPGNYLDWKSQNDVFQQMAGFVDANSVFSDGSRSEELRKQNVSADLLPLLGVQPLRGRLFTPEDDRPDVDTVILVSYRLWQSWFGGAEDIVGRVVQVNSTPRTIIGVMPPDFYFRNREVDFWQPLGLNPAKNYRETEGRWLSVIGRLKPGVSVEQAQAEMTTIATRLERAYPKLNTNWTVAVEPLRDSMVREVKTSLLILLGAVGLLLAVACANVANLLIARCAARRREMAVRASLGAGRGRVIRQLLTESIVLGVAGGVLGLLFARGAVATLLEFAPHSIARSAEIVVDLRIVAVAFAVSILTGIAFGLAPAFVASRASLIGSLQQRGRGNTAGGTRLRSALVAGEVALAVMLLAGAGLLIRSLAGLQAVDPGLNPSHLLTFRVSLPAIRFQGEFTRTQFNAQALERIERLPGVRSASAVSYLPFDGITSATYVNIAGRAEAKPGEELVAAIRTVMPGYFRTMGIPLLHGRTFSADDDAQEAPQRFVVNESFVDKFLPGQDPLATRINALMADKNPFGDIIGVVGDVREGSVDKEPMPTVYYAHAQLTYSSMVYVVRTETDPRALVEPARRAIQGLDPQQPIAQVRTMEEVLGETLARHRFSALLLAGFSLASLLLAAVGVYGVLAYAVSERTREMGVRVAVGAAPRQIASMIVGQGTRLVVAGAAAGLAGAMALSGLLESLLFGVGARDPVTLVSVTLVILLAALLAAWIPARRAAGLDPIAALRSD
jgi:putative ABC transport system permease protein